MTKTIVFRAAIPVAIGLAWIGSVGFGVRKLLIFENTPGAAGTSPKRWPLDSKVVRPPGKFTLVLFAHPDCPCTGASLTELESLMTRLQGKMAASVEFRKPGASEPEVRDSTLWRKAGSIPGVSVALDSNGIEVARFGAEVSGQALLYAPSGRLVFSGGITDARGHEGDNAGVDAVILRVKGGEAPFHAPTFGCSLRDPDAQTLSEDSAWKKP